MLSSSHRSSGGDAPGLMYIKCHIHLIEQVIEQVRRHGSGPRVSTHGNLTKGNDTQEDRRDDGEIN